MSKAVGRWQAGLEPWPREGLAAIRKEEVLLDAALGILAYKVCNFTRTKQGVSTGKKLAPDENISRNCDLAFAVVHCFSGNIQGQKRFGLDNLILVPHTN